MSALFLIHIPKTAGTSLRTGLLGALGDRLVLAYPGNPDYDLEATLAKPLPTGAVIFGHFNWGLHYLFRQPPRYATVLRHPVDRIRSWYEFQRADSLLPSHVEANEKSLAEMVRGGHPELNNHMTAMLAGATEGGASPLVQALDHLGRCEWLSTNSELEASLGALSDLVGAPIQMPARLNVGPKADSVNEDDVGIIAEYNDLDMLLFEQASSMARIRANASRLT